MCQSSIKKKLKKIAYFVLGDGCLNFLNDNDEVFLSNKGYGGRFRKKRTC